MGRPPFKIDINQHLKPSAQLNHAKLRLARRLIVINGVFYVVLASGELVLGHLTHAAALMADGQNNVSGIFSATLLWVGLTYANMPSDAVHREGHWQFESLAVFLSGLVMILVGLNCMWGALKQTWQVLQAGSEHLTLIAVDAAAISGVILLIEAGINDYQGRRTHNSALLASAKDYLSDALTSFTTMLVISVALITHWYLVDTLSALVIGGYIVICGAQIVSASATRLSNGFEPKRQAELVKLVTQIPAVHAVAYLRGRYVGDLIIITMAVQVLPNLTVAETSEIRQKIIMVLTRRYPLLDCCVAFVPTS
ncbi:cation diffusion facilitator family transporter [Lactiplantibacillus fabifermentans]|uniref:Cation transporter n=1 Tax=Lactiplantibacillus fabifermentans T30PCM01 TaxID=1400520 RepID=W6T8E9_9LACO|nr:cation diffusion facilitator family transporter [Lactiplantibacillus fabifermentans]ETY74711.1 cation transporter [Lactiplantibacillus fabifermentans T30PCM01]